VWVGLTVQFSLSNLLILFSPYDFLHLLWLCPHKQQRGVAHTLKYPTTHSRILPHPPRTLLQILLTMELVLLSSTTAMNSKSKILWTQSRSSLMISTKSFRRYKEPSESSSPPQEYFTSLSPLEKMSLASEFSTR
jgi:hypothetical protein